MSKVFPYHYSAAKKANRRTISNVATSKCLFPSVAVRKRQGADLKSISHVVLQIDSHESNVSCARVPAAREAAARRVLSFWLHHLKGRRNAGRTMLGVF